MNSRETIEQFIRRSFVWSLALSIFRGLVRAVPVIVVGVLLLGLGDAKLELPPSVRVTAWCALFLIAAFAFATGFYPWKIFSLKERSRRLSQRQGRLLLRSDDLLIAGELLAVQPKSGASSEMIDVTLDRMAERLSERAPRDVYPAWPWQKRFALAALLCFGSVFLWAMFPTAFPLSGRVLFPFGSAELNHLVTVTPGDVNIPWGTDVDVRLAVLQRASETPKLFVRMGNDWVAVDPLEENAKAALYRFKNVVEPLNYRVRWRNEWGKKFQITPVHPLEVRSFALTLTPPAYLGTASSNQTTPEVTALAGTNVLIHVEASRAIEKAKLVFADGRAVAADQVKASGFDARFSVSADTQYDLEIAAADGSLLKTSAHYPVHVIVDQPPTIRLLSPDQDLVIGLDEKLPITYEASDDFALRRIDLEWERNGSHTEPIRHLNGNENSLLATYSWDLAASGFKSGDVIRYRVGAVDSNTITGPGRAFSPWRTIEIASFEKKHAEIEAALEQWRDHAVELLAEANTLKSKIDKSSNTADLMGKFAEMQRHSAILEDVLKHLVDHMEEDPLADYGVWMEHKAMAQNMESLNKNEMKATEAALHTGNKPEASANLEQMAGELERMTALSEDLTKTQNARDVLQSGNDLKEASEDLMKELSAAGNKVDEKTAKRVNELVQKAEELLQKMANSLQKMPQDLPEDFVNQKAIKEMDLGKSQDILSQINDAMKKGDAARAMELAQKLMQAAERMQKQLEDAHQSFVDAHSQQALAKKISEQQKKLEEIANDQVDIISETQKLDAKRMEAAMKEQESLLKTLAARQKAVIADTRAASSTKGMPPKHAINLQLQTLPMSKVLEEFSTARVLNAPHLLTDIVGSLHGSEAELKLSSETATNAQQVTSIVTEEESILDTLKKQKEPEVPFTPQEKEKFSDLKTKQQQVASRTDQLKKEVQKIARQTATMGSSVTQALSSAMKKMDDAAQHLSGTQSLPALRAEEEALQALNDGQSEFEQAQSGMSEMAGQQGFGQGSGGSGGLKVMSRGTNGTRGMKTEPVRLPTVDEYRPPKEFREELLKSLKEKYPQVYEDIIHRYYKRLSE